MTSESLSVLVEKLSRTFEDNEALVAVCRDIASEIESGRRKVHAIVEELGTYLTNTDVGVRANGVKTLSLITGYLPDDYLNESELRLLTLFYCDRLKDHHTIGPATIAGILAIVQMKHLPEDAPTRLLQCIFQHIRCQSELQETRRNIYMIFQILLQNHLDDLKPMGPDFVYGVISSMDGECDPRNLMLLFNVLPLFIKEFPLGHLTEEMFEVVACYFPIDFNSSITADDKKNKKKITRDDLAEALAPCLYAIPEFAEFCLPHVMEKLDSDRKIAKLDSLSILSKGASTFGSRGLRHHIDELWPLLKREAMSVSDRETKKLALTTINEIVKALADDDDQIRKSFVEKIFIDTRWSLCDVQLSLYWPAEKILEAVARTGKISCAQVLMEIVPLCLGQYTTKTSSSHKVTLMETLNNFIKICADFHFTIADIPELAWTDIPGLYLNELGETKDGALRAKALSGLIVQKVWLKEGQRMTVYEKVCEMIDSDISDDVRNMCHSTLFAFAKFYPNEMLEILKKRLQINVDNPDTAVLTRRLEAISMLSKISEIGVVVLPQMIEIAISKKSKVDTTAMSCLCRILASPNIGFDIHEYLYSRCNTIERLFTCDCACLSKLFLISGVCRSIVRKLRLENQQDIVDRYVKEKKFTDRDVVLYEGILTPLRQSVQISNIYDLILSMYNFATETDNSETRLSTCKIIATLVNKMSEDMNFHKVSNNLRERIVDILETKEASSIERKKFAATLHTWLTKSLVLRGSENSQKFLDYQINLLRLDSVGSHVAEEFRTLVDKSENILTQENFGRIKIFYKQRIFQNVIKSNECFEAESRQNYLVALAHLVEEVPIELPFMHLQGLVPLLIESLSLDDGQLLLSSLKTLKLLLETKHDIFLNQIQCFVPKCLHLATYKKMNVRIAALDCLLSYCNYPVVELLKYKQEVLDKLSEPLDDHKRLVRQIAVKASTRWYLVGANGGPDQ